MIPVEDADDPRVAEYRRLNDQAVRRAMEGDEYFISEGWVSIDRLIDSGHVFRSALLSPSRVNRFLPFMERPELTGVPVYVAEREVMHDLVGFDLPRAVLVSADRHPLHPIEHLAATSQRLVVLEALAGKVEEVKGSLSMGLRDFRLLEPEIQRRFLVASIGWIAGGDYAPRAGSVSELGFALADRKTHTLAGVIGWVSKDRIWLAREDRAVTGTEGNPFDGRWQVEGPLEGLTVRALGAAGLKQLPDWRASGLPRRVLLPLPGVWKGDWLVSAPLIGPADRFKVTLLRPNFDKWLRQH